MEGTEPNTVTRDTASPGDLDGAIFARARVYPTGGLCGPGGYADSDDDRLAPARGLVVGIAIGSAIWSVLIALAVLLLR